MRTIILLLIISFFWQESNSQSLPKQLQAKRTTSTIKIDGNIDDEAWKTAIPATDFIEWRPDAGKPEPDVNKTIVYILYDNTSVYIGGYCHELTKDSISRELIGRDKVGVNDFVGVVLDTYNDKSNAVGFYVTPYGEQYDAKYSPDRGEDGTWSAVWDSESKIHNDGWSFEMRIPYSALRFVSRENQTWGLNITRRRNKTGQQYMWNPLDPKISGFINQGGEWTGIEKIDAPIRLSFSPYLSANVNHYKPDTKDWRKAINGGMDVKYGISESFTLDMTLIPDFGQVQSDNRILNLSPFEVQYNENRPFFTEGTELFNKGNLFYSRRIGGMPIHYGNVNNQIKANETVIRNPQEAKLVNATKLSGRTKNGLGIGFFNAITKPMFAEVEDHTNKQIRKVETSPFTNYNIIVLDQTLKNNSSVSFINTNVLRNGSDYDANVSAGLFNFNNKKNTYNLNGKLAVSHLTNQSPKFSTGYAHTLVFGKTGGRWNYQVVQDVADQNYNINDMGILFNSNYFNHSVWTAYRWIQPKDWYKRIQVNFNAGYRRLFKEFTAQKVNTNFQGFFMNVNGNAQFKNLWYAGFFAGFNANGNDFYEPRETGWSFDPKQRIQFEVWVETNSAKKYYSRINYNVTFKELFGGRSHGFNVSHRYRFNDKFSVTQSTSLNPSINDAGYYAKYKDSMNGVPVLMNGASVTKDVIFSRRDRMTVENVLAAKYNFNNKAGLTFRVRHYSSKVMQKQLYDLQNQGNLTPTSHNNVELIDRNLNLFNIDAVYTWQFAPGSFINVVWKNEGLLENQDYKTDYFKNFDRTLSEPQNDNLSIKIIYYLDYLDIKKWRKKAS